MSWFDFYPGYVLETPLNMVFGIPFVTTDKFWANLLGKKDTDD